MCLFSHLIWSDVMIENYQVNVYNKALHLRDMKQHQHMKKLYADTLATFHGPLRMTSLMLVDHQMFYMQSKILKVSTQS